MKKIAIGLALMLAMSLTAMAQSQVEKGKQVFIKDNCARCHGSEGQGGAGRRLTPLKLSTEALTAYVRHPTGQMPPYRTQAQVSDADLADIRAYLATIKAPPAVKDIPLLNQ